MDAFGAEQFETELSSLPLGPEWLSFAPAPASALAPAPVPPAKQLHFDDQRGPLRPKQHPQRKPESKVLIKSKSSPDNGVFRVVKEPNAFEQDFPILNTPQKNAPSSSSSASSSSPARPPESVLPKQLSNSAWRQPITETLVPKILEKEAQPQNTTSRSSKTVSEEYESEITRSIVAPKLPGAHKQKKTIKQDLHEAKQKNQPVVIVDPKPKKKPPPTPQAFRKAVSEPTLPLNDPKFLAARSRIFSEASPSAKPASEKPKASSNRNEFFENLKRREQQALQQDSNAEKKEDKSPSPSPSPPPVQISLPEEKASPSLILPSVPGPDAPSPTVSLSLSFNPQDEERFLRTLGWKPEEEDHIPELTEEEINDAMANRIKQAKSKPHLIHNHLAIHFSPSVTSRT